MGDFLGNREARGKMAVRGRESVEASFSFEQRTRELEIIYSGLFSGTG